MGSTAASLKPGNSSDETFTSLARTSRPASACSGSSSRGSSRAATPKWVPAALAAELQHYRNDPRALELLQKRVKEYSRPSSPRKTPTGVTAAAQPLAPWAASATQSAGSSRPCSAPASPQSCRTSLGKPPGALVLSTEHSGCCCVEGAHDSGLTSPALSPVTLSHPHARKQQQQSAEQQQQQQHQDERLQQTHQHAHDHSRLASSSPDMSQHSSSSLSCTAALNPGQELQQQQELQKQEQAAAAGGDAAAQESSTGLQGSNGYDAALQLQQLLEHAQQPEQQEPACTSPGQQQQQQQQGQDEVWRQITQAQLDQQATIIQRAWSSTRIIRGAQQQLLCRAMLHLEQQLIRSNAAAARAAERAEVRAQACAAAEAATTGGAGPGTRSSSWPVEAAPAACETEHHTPFSAAAAGHSGSILSSSQRHVHTHTRHSAPPVAAAAAALAMHPARTGRPLVLAGDFFDAVEEADSSCTPSEPFAVASAAAAAALGAPGSSSSNSEPKSSAAVRSVVGRVGLQATARPKSASAAASAAAAGRGYALPVTNRSSGQSRPQSARPSRASAAAAAAGVGSMSRPRSASVRARPQSARPSAAASPSSGRLSGAAASGVAAAALQHPLQHRQHGGGSTHASTAATAAGHAAASSSGSGRSAVLHAPAAAPVTAAAAAPPAGPLPARGVQLTGQLTPLTVGPDSSGNLSLFAHAAMPGSPAAAGPGPNSCWLESAAAGTFSFRSRSIEQQQQHQGKGRQKSGGLAGSPTGGVGVVWNEAEGVVDLEVEAQLKTLTEVVSADVRQQVAQEQLVRARRQLLAAMEAHADRAASYRSQLEAEAVLHQALSAVAGASVDTTSRLGPPPPRPCLHLVPSRQELKALVAAAMDLQQEQASAAACADSDTLDHPPPRRAGGSSSGSGVGAGGGGSSSGGRGSSVSGGRGLSLSGGRLNS